MSQSSEQIYTINCLLETEIFNQKYYKEAELIKIFGEFLNERLETKNLHKNFWEYSDDLDSDKLKFGIILEGCLAVMTKINGEYRFDSLLFPGQVVGEFELLGNTGINQKLFCLTDKVVVFNPSQESLNQLRKTTKFYENLSRTLMTKLMIQNSFFRIIDHKQIYMRVKKLLCKFRDAKNWQQFVTFIDENKNSYEIKIKWSLESLNGSVSSTTQSVPNALHNFCEEGFIEVFQTNDLKKPNKESKITKKEQFIELNNDSCIRIKVIDHEGLHHFKLKKSTPK